MVKSSLIKDQLQSKQSLLRTLGQDSRNSLKGLWIPLLNDQNFW